jgi:LacI family transcriptional regulator
VLNGTRVVSDDLRDRVLEALQELHYEPNAVARSLKLKRSNSLGLVISDIGNPFFTAVVRGVEDVARQRGFALILCNSDEDPVKEAEYLRILASRRVDGLILAPAGERHDYLARLARSHFPLVFLDREVPDLDVPAVVLDGENAAHTAVRHLIEHGHRRIGMVAGRPRISTTVARIAGYRRALAEAGIAEDDRLIVSGGSRTEEAHAAAATLLEQDPRPTAFFVANNLMTIGTVEAIQERGLSIPDDVALVGFDDFSWADVFRPRLTTVAQPTYELGRRAAELLVRRIEGDVEGTARRVVLKGRLIVRESCGARTWERAPIAERAAHAASTPTAHPPASPEAHPGVTPAGGATPAPQSQVAGAPIRLEEADA